ncbi:MAG: hypothetical protein NWF09_01280 [Candidatus Bathyarchaeota archaeon]|nr:hypothetical protein [Candidatus Bathyarchaeota archaeon]
MPTTVKVDKKNLQMLTKIKKEMKAKNNDETIKRLISERQKIPSSMFGSNRKLAPFSAADEAEFH